jgi:hypothetical protein
LREIEIIVRTTKPLLLSWRSRAEHESAAVGCRVYACSCFGWMNRVRDADDEEQFANLQSDSAER